MTTPEGPVRGVERVFKKSSPNSMLTMYLSTRELVSKNGIVTPLKGIVWVDPKFVAAYEQQLQQQHQQQQTGISDETNIGMSAAGTSAMTTVPIGTASISSPTTATAAGATGVAPPCDNNNIKNTVDIKFIQPIMQPPRIFAQLTLTFRYGREDEEVMGLRFCNEAIICLRQVWPPLAFVDTEALTPLQDALLKRLGDGAYPFTLTTTPQAPPSVQLVPAKRYYGSPIGTSYDVRCYVADQLDEVSSRRTTVRMGVRVIHINEATSTGSTVTETENFSTLDNNHQISFGDEVNTSPSTSPPTLVSSSSMKTKSKPERMESLSKLKLSPKAFRFTGKLCRSKSEVEKESPSQSNYRFGFDSNLELGPCRGPQKSIDKPFLLQEGRVGLRASLDKSMYTHGEAITVTIDIKNNSKKTVKKIRILAIQYVDVCMFSNGKFKNIVAETGENCPNMPIGPGGTINTKYTLKPQRGQTKNWIALEDSLQRSNEPNEIKALIASSALPMAQPLNLSFSSDEKNIFAIYVSYYVKIKLTLSGMGGELSLKLPFILGYTDTINGIATTVTLATVATTATSTARVATATTTDNILSKSDTIITDDSINIRESIGTTVTSPVLTTPTESSSFAASCPRTANASKITRQTKLNANLFNNDSYDFDDTEGKTINKIDNIEQITDDINKKIKTKQRSVESFSRAISNATDNSPTPPADDMSSLSIEEVHETFTNIQSTNNKSNNDSTATETTNVQVHASSC